MPVDISIYRALVGLHYCRLHKIKGLRHFTNFEFLVFIGMVLCRSGDIESNPGPDTSTVSLDNSLSDFSSEFRSVNYDQYFSLVHYNVQSLLPKHDLIETELTKFDLISITETWLNDSVSDSDLTLTGFKPPFRYDRPTDTHGGVAIYIKENLYSKRRCDLEIRDVECVWVEVIIKHNPILIGTFYRPPNSSAAVLTNIETSIGLAFDTGIKDIIITGDFNLDYLKTDTRRKITDICRQYNLQQIIDEPTHFTESSSSLIDIYLVNNPRRVVLSSVGEPFLSQNTRYHCPIYCFYDFRKEQNTTFKRKIWLYDRGDYDGLRNDISSTNWNNLCSNDLNMYALNISDRITKSSEKYIPNKYATIRTADPPWLDNSIRKLIKKRRRLFAKAKRTKTTEDMDKYKQYRNKVTKSIQKAKKNHTDKLSDKLKSGSLSSKDWWNTLKSFIKDQNSTNIPPIKTDSDILSSNLDKANVLNEYFIKQTNLNDENVPLPDINIPRNIPVLQTIFLTPEEVEDALQTLKLGKSSGPDGINNRVLKELSSELANPLCSLYNFSLQHSIVPDSWKEANVSPIYKKDDPSDVSNYRPISLLNTLGKVFEKIVHKHLFNFLSSHKIITNLQSGFVPGDSTVNQLVTIYDTFCKALDDGKEVRAVFCDVSKAFDRVWHRGLLLKLRSVGITGSLLNWFSDYLSNRRQRVVLPGACSDWKNITAGVPQGSILGPLLFLIFINDIVNDLDTNVRLFADDTSLYIIVDTPENAALKLNNDLRKIHSWATQWLVTFNPSKSETLLISRKRSRINHPALFMNNQQLIEVESHKHLGLIFSNDGTWHAHIDLIASKAWTRVNVMRKLKFILNRKALQMIYTTFIRPVLEYSDIIWDNCTQYEKNELDKIQLEAARIVTGSTKLVSSARLNSEVGWENLSSRRRKHKLTLFYKMLNGITPDYLTQLVPSQVNQASMYNLRNSDNYLTIRTSSQLYYNSFLPSVVREWNALPETSKTSPSVDAFKQSLNTVDLKKPSYYFIGERIGQIHHSRLRTNCSILKEHLFTKNIVNDPQCACGAIETTSHFLLECNAFDEIRQDMFDEISPFCEPLLDILLFGCNTLNEEANTCIFKSVQKFILRSKRFKRDD